MFLLIRMQHFRRYLDVCEFWLKNILNPFISKYLFITTSNSNSRPINSIPKAPTVILFAHFDYVKTFRLLIEVQICVGHKLSTANLIAAVSLDLVQTILFESVSFSFGDFVQLIILVLL